MQKIKDLILKFKEFIKSVKTWSLKKKLTRLSILIFVVFIVYNAVSPDKIDPDSIVIVPVESKDIVSTVKASGSVTSVTDLNLSFKSSDLVDRVNVTVGQKIKKGTILATLKNSAELGALTQARASLASAKASLQKTIEGATTEEVRVAEVTLESAKRTLDSTKKLQDTLVRNAKSTLYSSSLAAVSTYTNSTNTAPTISGTYTGDSEDEYTINIYPTGAGNYASFTSLSGDSGSVPISTSGPIAMGKNGLYVNFSTATYSTESYKIKIPNTASSTYVTNLNALKSAEDNRQSAIESAQGAVDAAQANLDLKKAAARPADITLKEAEVLRAEGQLQSAQGAYENTIIRAPADGTITKVDIKVGELAKALEPVIVLQDITNLYVEANINESNITNVAIGQNVDLTIDGYGSEKIFKGLVTEVEPGATIENGIVNYKVKVSMEDKDPNIKPGMSSNIIITTATKPGVIAIPQATVFEKEGKKFVRVITSVKKKKYIEREVTLGSVGSDNLAEVVSGLSLGESVALVSK